MLAEALAWANAVLGLTLAYFTLRYLCSSNRQIGRWVKVTYAMIGLYWGALYLFVALNPPNIVDPVWFGQVWVRPAFTGTLAVMTAGAIYRWRSRNE